MDMTKTQPRTVKKRGPRIERPQGQRALIHQRKAHTDTLSKVEAAGFKKITHEQLRERFCCDLVGKQETERKEKAVGGYKGNTKRFLASEDMIGFYIIAAIIAAIVAACGRWGWPEPAPLAFWLGFCITVPAFYTFIMLVGSFISYYSILSECEMICNVKYDEFEKYDQDVIPDRCYTNIKRARKAGLTNISVAYPVLEKVEKPVAKDPVIVAENKRLDIPMHEIDMWE